MYVSVSCINEAKRCGAERFGAERSDAMRRITESGVMRQRVESTNAIQKCFLSNQRVIIFHSSRRIALGLDANYTQDPSACLQPHNGIYFLYDANLTTVYTFFTTPKCLPRNLESSMSALVESKETGAPGDHPVTFKRRARRRCSSRACS